MGGYGGTRLPLLPEHRLLITLGGIVAVLLTGVAGYMLIEGWSFLDALFMTVTTVATVGYREVRPLSLPGRWFTMGLIIAGVGFVFYSLGIVVEMMIEGGLREILGRRRVEREIRTLKDHYIVCGYGRMGTVVAGELLKRKLPFIVIDADAAVVQSALERGILAIQGNAGDEETLRRANIEQARGLVAVAASDAENLFITITAKSLNSKLLITSRAETKGTEQKMVRVGADKVVSPYLIGAYRLVSALLQPAVARFIELSSLEREMDVRLEEIGVSEKSSLDGKFLKDTPIRSQLGIIIIGIEKKDGKMIFNPPPDHMIKGGDKLITIGTSEQTERLIKMAT
ncbi:MAG: potassium channel protein [Candidatus Abyssobacteria bacterium SURF_5]|uniref:Potassium channel protein n=1 Tax=Abyssobacteria bacterium (strain SURF_5) TaxID=2093360 RepID=A0A3A4P0B5_ABYX5|nr:MAG: potassium channel protein [Candidatus Abyssubacteria bacterium SURF_5]